MCFVLHVCVKESTLPCALPVGCSAMAPDVLVAIELLCCSWNCTYDPNCCLQCLSWSMLDPVTIVRGLSVTCMPSLCGKQFIQNITLYTILTISLCGSVSNGNVLTIALALSFTVRMNLSISGTCSSLPVMFIFMPCCSM